MLLWCCLPSFPSTAKHSFPQYLNAISVIFPSLSRFLCIMCSHLYWLKYYVYMNTYTLFVIHGFSTLGIVVWYSGCMLLGSGLQYLEVRFACYGCCYVGQLICLTDVAATDVCGPHSGCCVPFRLIESRCLEKFKDLFMYNESPPLCSYNV